MWLVIGRRVKTERVPGGAREERRCGECGEQAVFYERRIVSTFQLYFLDVLDYGKKRVMACGACGALYATDGGGAVESTSLLGAIEDLGARASEAIGRVGDAVLGPSSPPEPAPRHRDEREDERVEDDGEDDLAFEPDPEKAALLRRFAELERKLKEKEGSDT